MSENYIAEALPAFLHTWRTVCREAEGLDDVRRRLFVQPLTPASVRDMVDDKALSDRIEAFGARYGRLQDQLGEKALPRLLALFGATPRTLLDTLNAAERLGVLASAEHWLVMRALRNRLVHEYLESSDELLVALQAAEPAAGALLDTVARMRTLLRERGIPVPDQG